MNRVLAIEPNDPAALNNKGNSISSARKISEAIRYYDRALAIEPNNTEVLNNKGASLSSPEKYEEAIGYYDRALAIKPNYSLPLNNKANAIVEMVFEGANILENSYSVKPYYFYIVSNQTPHPLASNIKQIELALEIYDKALDMDPNSPIILTNKATLLMKIGKYNEALDLFNKALTSDPNHAPALFNKGVLWIRWEELDESFDLKQKAGGLIQIMTVISLTY